MLDSVDAGAPAGRAVPFAVCNSIVRLDEELAARGKTNARAGDADPGRGEAAELFDLFPEPPVLGGRSHSTCRAPGA